MNTNHRHRADALALALALALTVVALLGCAISCSSGGAGDPRSEAAREPAIVATLPSSAHDFAPAEMRLAPASRITGRDTSDIDGCAECHPDVAAQWSSSAHAWASFNNPVYRVSIDRFRADVNNQASRFCAGCHDIALLIDRAMVDEIRPDDMRAHAGVNCKVCHGVAETRNDGNGSYTLAEHPLFVPDVDDPESVARHREAASVRHLESELCVTCHRSFLGPETGNAHHLSGMDDASDWQRSAHAGQGVARVDGGVPVRDCMACHMSAEPVSERELAGGADRRVSSHRFAGGHTWLASMLADTDQAERVSRMLEGVMSIDIAVALTSPPAQQPEESQMADQLPRTERVMPAESAALHPGGQLALDVVLRNLGVGHRFPGGVKDAQDVWLEVAIHDATGRLVASSGQAHAHDPDDTEAHVLRALVADEHGVIRFAREVHDFRAVIVDHTIAPRDAVVVRYQLDVPPASAGLHEPFSATAVLRHRTRNLILQERACAERDTDQGRAFARASQALRGSVLDACPAQPITDMAQTRIWLGRGAHQRATDEPRATRPDWQRLYEHGMAWTHAIQERLEEARPSLETALDKVRADPRATPRDQAMIMAALARLSGRQGRTDEALEWLDRAAALAPGVPALDAIRAAALTQVWRWAEAEAPLLRVTQAVPENDTAWAALAVTLGSLGKSREALDAARRGLAIQPRDGTLLRVQALSVRALHGPDADAALDAYDRFRKTDQTTEIRFTCAARSPSCAREREPVHTHHLLPALDSRPGSE